MEKALALSMLLDLRGNKAGNSFRHFSDRFGTTLGQSLSLSLSLSSFSRVLVVRPLWLSGLVAWWNRVGSLLRASDLGVQGIPQSHDI